MKAEKVLYITQEVKPYSPETPMSLLGHTIPAQLTEDGRQVRTFMPLWGTINVRRHQLHEVQRLSGMNIIIDESDHTLVIKVASVPQSRTQVYFIDNDDYFHKRGALTDEAGNPYEDNVERAIFFARGVLETVKKFRWIPDVIHCHGWMSIFAPLLIRTAYKDDPPFTSARILFSAYGPTPEALAPAAFSRLVRFRSLNDRALRNAGLSLKNDIAPEDLLMTFCDAYAVGAPDAAPRLFSRAREEGKPVMELVEGDATQACIDFYDKLLDEVGAE